MARNVKIYSEENMKKILESLASGDLYNIPFVDKTSKKWIVGTATGIIAKNNDKDFTVKNGKYTIVRNDNSELSTGVEYESGISVYINSGNNYYYVGYDTQIGANESGINKVSDYSKLPSTAKNTEVYICLNNYTNPADSTVHNKGIYYYDEITGKWNTIINTDRPTAQNVTYSNSTSKINSTNVQSAIDEVYSNLKTQISNFQVLQSASGIAYDDSLSGLNASNVQEAIETINTKVTNGDFNFASKYQKGMVKIDEETVRVNPSNQIYIPNATDSKAGLVKPDGTTVTVDSDGIISSVVPTAGTGSAGTLGGVRVDGSTITIDANGVISSSGGSGGGGTTYDPADDTTFGVVKIDNNTIKTNASDQIYVDFPKATTTDVGVVKVDGTSITVDSDGVISATAGSNVEVDNTTIKKNSDGKIYAVLPTAATNENVGLVKPDGTSITIADGVISATAPSVASTTESGTVKVDGTSITINEGVISANVTGASIGKATTDTLGAVMVDGTSITVDSDGKISSVIPTASDTTLGGVKIDNDTIVINGDGKIEVDFPEASESQKGIVQIDGSTIVLEDGVIKATASAGYTLPAATSTTLGGVIIDDNTIKINEDGKIYSTAQGGGNVTVDGTSITKSDDGTISAHVVDKAGVGSSGSLGGVKVDDSTIKIDENGVISVEFPTASETVAGLIKVDNDSITINEDGQIEAKSAKALPIATTEKAGIIKIGDNLTVDSDGVLTTDLEADDIEYSNSDVTDAGSTIANTKQMLDYLNSKKDTTVTGLQNVINGTTDISFTAVTSSLTSATTIHKAIEDLDDKFNSLSGYTADRVQFDNTKSGTTMINVQNAMDELYSSVKRAEAIGSIINVDKLPVYNSQEDPKTITYIQNGVTTTSLPLSMMFRYVDPITNEAKLVTYIDGEQFIFKESTLDCTNPIVYNNKLFSDNCTISHCVDSNFGSCVQQDNGVLMAGSGGGSIILLYYKEPIDLSNTANPKIYYNVDSESCPANRKVLFRCTVDPSTTTGQEVRTGSSRFQYLVNCSAVDSYVGTIDLTPYKNSEPAYYGFYTDTSDTTDAYSFRIHDFLINAPLDQYASIISSESGNTLEGRSDGLYVPTLTNYTKTYNEAPTGLTQADDGTIFQYIGLTNGALENGFFYKIQYVEENKFAHDLGSHNAWLINPLASSSVGDTVYGNSTFTSVLGTISSIASETTFWCSNGKQYIAESTTSYHFDFIKVSFEDKSVANVSVIDVDSKPSISSDKTTIYYTKDGVALTTDDTNKWFYYTDGTYRYYLSYKDGEELILEEDFVYSDDDIANAVEEDSGTATTINLNPVVPKIVNGEWYIGDTATGVYATTEITNIRRDENDHLVITAADGATGTDYDCGEIAAKNYYNGAVNAQNLVVSGDAMYSTAEKVVGCWIDKKPIYRKIYILESVQLLQAVQLNIEEVLNNVDTMTNLYGNINCSDGWCQSINLYESASSLNYVTYNKDTHILHYANFARQGKLYIYFEYTKTTDAENSFVPEMLQGVTVTGGAPNETFTEQEIDTMADADKF